MRFGEQDLANTKQAQQVALREKFGKLAASSAADISNDLKAFFEAEGVHEERGPWVRRALGLS